MNRRWFLVGLAVLAALLLGFLLRDVVDQLIIRPVTYLLWWLGFLYQYIPQPVIWLVLVLGMVYFALGWLTGHIDLPEASPRKSRPVRGPVADLAAQIERRHGGIYFKWQIARTLGQIALDLQELRLHIRSRRLESGVDKIPARVYQYIDSGLTTSFADYSLPESLPITSIFSLRGKPNPNDVTPFDGDINPVIEYLEAEMESYDDLRRT